MSARIEKRCRMCGKALCECFECEARRMDTYDGDQVCGEDACEEKWNSGTDRGEDSE